MKLIDILVEELPKRGGWPKGADYVVQDNDGSLDVKFGAGEATLEHDQRGVWVNDMTQDWGIDTHESYIRDFNILACDASTTIITREQHEAALSAKNDGWIAWGGGKCPLHHGAIVDVKLRNGRTEYAQKALSTEAYASYPFWRNDGTGGDIIAYRLHQPQEVEQAEADDEADLNECIGQDAAPVWNGEGLPPVGVECEYSWAGEPWASGVIRYISKHTIIIETQADSTGDTECAYHPTDIKLRPFRTEADRKRDEAVEAIDRYMPEFIPDTPNDYYNAKKIYDAIAAGKIPGVKLEG